MLADRLLIGRPQPQPPMVEGQAAEAPVEPPGHRRLRPRIPFRRRQRHRPAVLVDGHRHPVYSLLRRPARFRRHLHRAQPRILLEHVRHMHGQAAVHRGDLRQLVPHHAGRRKNRKLPREDVQQQQRQGHEQHHRRQPHQQIGHNQPVAHLPQQLRKDKPPQQRHADHQQQVKGAIRQQRRTPVPHAPGKKPGIDSPR